MSKVKGVVSSTDTMAAKDLKAYGARLEELGYDALWLPDLMGREIFAAAGFVLANTTRLRVATGIANIYARDPMTTAQAARTLSELHDGRFILGLGVSNKMAAEIRGHQWKPPIETMRSYLESVAAAQIRSPKPEKPAPVFIAAHGPKMLGVAAELTDGANTYLMPPEHTRRAREILGPDKALNVVLPCLLCDDEERAHKMGRKGLSIYLGLPAYRREWRRYGLQPEDLEGAGSDRLIDTLIAWGDGAAIRKRMAEHIEAGADEIEIIPYGSDPKTGGPPWELLEALAPQTSGH
jgi:probable F420-dependent oxidoreductase